MSFASRHTPRFSYTEGTSPPAVGERNRFFQSDDHNKSPALSMRSTTSVRRTPSIMSSLSSDDKTLFTIIGVGIILALVVDAVAHSSSVKHLGGNVVIGGRTYVPLS